MDTTQVTQLIVAITALVTAFATLAKVFSHDTTIKQTQATVETIQHQTNSQLETLQGKVDILKDANLSRLVAEQATPAELAARQATPTTTPPVS